MPLSKSLMGPVLLVGLVVISSPGSAGGLGEFVEKTVQDARDGKVDVGLVGIDANRMKIDLTSPLETINGPEANIDKLKIGLNPGLMSFEFNLEGDGTAAKTVNLINSVMHIPRDLAKKITTDTLEGFGDLISAPFRAIGQAIDALIDRFKANLDAAEQKIREGAPIVIIWAAAALFFALFLARMFSAAVMAFFRRRPKNANPRRMRRTARARSRQGKTIYIGGRPTAVGY